jgi:glycosyltransferase involved in cell wall biosynthesis
MQAAQHSDPGTACLNEAGVPGHCATVAVIIPTFNQAGFFADAIKTVLIETHEIIVVDDDSTDDPATVVAQFPNLRLIRQDSRGASAAHNTGLRSYTTSWRFTDASAQRLFSAAFRPENVKVVTYGNILAAGAFSYGSAVHELRKEQLDHNDSDYQAIIEIFAP